MEETEKILSRIFMEGDGWKIIDYDCREYDEGVYFSYFIWS